MKMKFIFLILIVLNVMYVFGADKRFNKRSKRAAYDLPDGWYYLIENVSPSFSCFADGYYADVDNGCQIYHVCHTIQTGYGNPQIMQYSFICGNNTVFDQLSLTCNYVEDSIPCESSPDFYYLNNRIGDPEANIHYDEDIELGSRYISSNRFGDRKVAQSVPQEEVGIEYNANIENTENYDS